MYTPQICFIVKLMIGKVTFLVDMQSLLLFIPRTCTRGISNWFVHLSAAAAAQKWPKLKFWATT